MWDLLLNGHSSNWKHILTTCAWAWVLQFGVCSMSSSRRPEWGYIRSAAALTYAFLPHPSTPPFKVQAPSDCCEWSIESIPSSWQTKIETVLLQQAGQKLHKSSCSETPPPPSPPESKPSQNSPHKPTRLLINTPRLSIRLSPPEKFEVLVGHGVGERDRQCGWED